MRNILLLILFLFTINLNSQSYICKDVNNTEFNIVITNNTYKIVLDSIIICTTLDTIIYNDSYIKCVPLSNLKDTMIIYNNGLVLFSSNMLASFVIVKEMTELEVLMLFDREYLYIRSD